MAGLPDGAALEGLGRFRQQRPHFRHFTGPDAKGVGQIFYDPVLIQGFTFFRILITDE